MSLIPLLFWQLLASLGEEIREAQKRSAQFLPSSLAPIGFSLLAAAPHASFAACFPFVVWSDRRGFRGNEVGSLQTTSVHYPRPNCASRHVQPLCSQQFRLAPG
jgi:hypothetical protein